MAASLERWGPSSLRHFVSYRRRRGCSRFPRMGRVATGAAGRRTPRRRTGNWPRRTTGPPLPDAHSAEGQHGAIGSALSDPHGCRDSHRPVKSRRRSDGSRTRRDVRGRSRAGSEVRHSSATREGRQPRARRRCHTRALARSAMRISTRRRRPSEPGRSVVGLSSSRSSMKSTSSGEVSTPRFESVSWLLTVPA